ncbi:MAG: hypothetical protein PWP65_778 [Clostridia bacterium]|nr:hypothetical protein [Clostridia bacterium]
MIRMRDKPYIILGLVIFLGLLAFPFWYNVGKASAAPEPSLDTPAIRQLSQKQCVEARSYMRKSHMQLLNDWRNWVVRDGDRIYVAENGKKYEISLQNSCLQCHSNKAQFCDQCHNYVGVAPDCWTCHIEPEENK